MIAKFMRHGTILVAGTLLTGLLGLAPERSVSAEEFFIPVRSIDEVTAGAMPTVTDITASEAVLVFESSIPLVCSVVYGESPDFGMIATDLDMNGGAHSDHHPVMAGLRPNTEYFFRVQGTAADVLKLAMIAVDRRLGRELPAARLLLTVHDELVLEAPEAETERLAEVVREEMEGVAELRVPLVVDVASGRNWYEAKA